MKNILKLKYKYINEILGAVTIIILSTVILGGCGQAQERSGASPNKPNAESGTTGVNSNSGIGSNTENNGAGGQTSENVTELEVRFGDNGKPFVLHLDDNETATAIARYVGSSDWRLPIYERDKDANYDVLQYYDISSRYEIPSNPQTVTSAKAGEVYYSDPNRIVLFYHDAEISQNYTRVGTFDATDEFISAVEENPVLEGWGNKIIQISQPKHK